MKTHQAGKNLEYSGIFRKLQDMLKDSRMPRNPIEFSEGLKFFSTLKLL